jgi:probable F420-dependent oxidoreductase
MKVSAILPNSGPTVTAAAVEMMARAAEEAGAHGLWVSDHLLLQASGTEGYPYSDGGQITWDPQDAYLEALCVCAFLAGITSRCRIGTAVLVLPQRNVLQTAKELATIDNLAGGRLVVGVGAGWNRGEMEALGHRFESRGTRLDEMVDVLRDSWSGRTSGYTGTELGVPADLVLQPVPRQRSGPPLLVGGMTGPAIRRAGQRGDGWLALAFADRWDGPGLAAAVTSYREQHASADRRVPPSMVLKLHCSPGAVDLLPGRIEEAAALGFEEVAVDLPWERGVVEACDVLAGLVRSQDPVHDGLRS